MVKFCQWKIWLVLSILITVSLLYPAGSSQAEGRSGRRVALIIGNGRYSDMTRLVNPRNDAEAIGRSLRELGFSLMIHTDSTRVAMEQQLAEFYRVGHGAELAVLFYAGHGIQIRDRSYLLPIDASVAADEEALYLRAIELDIIVKQMQRMAKIGLVLLDACRDNPGLEERLNSTTRASVFRNVRLLDVQRGTVLILYATSGGRKALDRLPGSKNSPFADALVKILGEQVPVETMAKLVSRHVVAATNGAQQPEVQGSLNDDVYLAGRCPSGMHRDAGVCLPDIDRHCPIGYELHEGKGCLASVNRVPLHKRPWFWPTIGSVITVGCSVAIIGLTLGIPTKEPSTDLGIY